MHYGAKTCITKHFYDLEVFKFYYYFESFDNFKILCESS